MTDAVITMNAATVALNKSIDTYGVQHARVETALSGVDDKKSELEITVSEFLASIQNRFKTTFFVSENGSDTTGNGSESLPFLTLKKAQESIDQYCQYLTIRCIGIVEMGGSNIELGVHQNVLKIISDDGGNRATVKRGIHEGSTGHTVGGFLSGSGVPTTIHVQKIAIEYPVPTAAELTAMESKPLQHNRYNGISSRFAGDGTAMSIVALHDVELVRNEGCLGVVCGGDNSINIIVVNSVENTGGLTMNGSWVAGVDDVNGTDVTTLKNVVSDLSVI